MNRRTTLHHGASGADHVHISNGGGGRQLPRVALLGTGKMGSTIASRLAAAGFDLTVWNRTRQRAEDLGIGRVADSPAAAVRAPDVIISSLTGPDAVRAAYRGPWGAVEGLRGQLLIEMSTAGPDVLAELAAAVGPRGRLVDAPILGSPAVVQSGQATILVGGEAADRANAASVLRHLGEVRQVGPLGSAARLKLIANSMLGDVILAAAELQVAGERAGLDRDDVFWVLQRVAPGLDRRRADIVEDRHVPTLFALRDLAKDLNLALALYRQFGADVPLTAFARSLIVAAAAESGALEITSVGRRYRSAARDVPVDREPRVPREAVAAGV